MELPAPYRHWQNQTRSLLEALVPYMAEGAADIPIDGPPSDHDAQADRLESFARPLLLAAHWLQSAEHPDDTALRARLGDWFQRGLAIGSDPDSPHYWGPDANYHQHHVEIGLLAIALQIAPAQLWNPLDQTVKDQVAAWLATARGNGIVNNNHYFMGVHILEFLQTQGYGHPTDRAVVDTFLDRLEGMYRGGGWFEDGINQAYDHYNAYAFHFYGLWWARLHGHIAPERADRWRSWARDFVRDYRHFFAASGEHPAFGRSITYRFNGINVFGLAVALEATDLPLGQLRRLCTRNLDFFLNQPITQNQGLLSIGWLNEFRDLGESYSCGGSPYWAAKGLSPLLLPPNHAFWHEAEQPLPAEEGDHTLNIPQAGLTVRSINGEVEILNSGSQISNVNLRFGAWKWSKTAYRTGTDFCIARPTATHWSPDSALTLELPDGRVFGRHSTVTVEMDESHLRYVSNLGFKHDQVNCGVDTGLWWKAGWLLQVHVVTNRQPGVLALGGYPVSAASAEELSQEESAGALVGQSTQAGSVLQPLLGFSRLGWDQRLSDDTLRTHIRADYHVTPIARTDSLGSHRGETIILAALAWTGPEQAEGALWEVISSESGRLSLMHPSLEQWQIEHPLLPQL